MTRLPVRSAVLAAAAARLSYAALQARPPGGDGTWSRTNHRGEPVTLLEGPAVAAGAVAGAILTPGLGWRGRAAMTVAGAGAAALGSYDDLAGSGSSRGFRGHLGALRHGELTTGAVKLAGIGAAGLAASALLGAGGAGSRKAGSRKAGSRKAGSRKAGSRKAGSRKAGSRKAGSRKAGSRKAASRGPRSRRAGAGALGAADVLINAGLVAGGANLLNLFDLRPGRALKVALGAGTVLAATSGPARTAVAAPLAAGAALLPEDLGERAMLGDGGANALGAMLGTAAAAALPRPARLATLAAIVGLTAASEVVSFTKVIERTAALRWLDMLGRRPAAAPDSGSPVGTDRATDSESTGGSASAGSSGSTGEQEPAAPATVAPQ
jgi:hypothetical protein